MFCENTLCPYSRDSIINLYEGLIGYVVSYLVGDEMGDLSEDVRQMLLERADLDTFNGADGERYSQGTLHFRNTLMGIQAAIGMDRFSGEMENNGVFIDDDAVLFRI